MPGPRPEDNYNPVNTVAPSTNAPNDYLNVRANPNQFGAQIGSALQGLGKTAENAGSDLVNVAVQQQGLANEHEATMAELQLAQQGGEIYNQYKNLEGLDASNAREKTVSAYMDLNNKIRDGISNDAARRAYDQLATRRLSYVVQDINGYASQQKKAAYKAGQSAAMNQFVNDTSSYAVASNPGQFNYNVQSALFSANTLFTAPEYGDFQSVPAKTGKDGRLEFDTGTEQGRVAQATYNDYVNKILDKTYSNAVSTLYSDPVNGSINKAIDFLNQNKDNMPAATYAKLSHSLAGPYRAAQTRDIAESVLGRADYEYQNSFSQGNPADMIKSLIPGAVVTSSTRTPEHNAEVGGVPDSQHLNGTALDLVLPKGTSFEQFKDNLAKNGIHTTELLNEGDHVHVAWGDKTKTPYVSQADYYRMNFDNILDNVRRQAQERFNDPTLEDQAVAHASQKMHQAISAQDMQQRVDQDTIHSFINGDSNKGIRVTSSDQLYNGPPQIRDAWVRYQANNPMGAERIEKGLITANARGQALGYGSQFWKNYSDLASGRVKDVTDFSVSGDKNSPFTNTGFNELYNRQKQWATPEGHTEQQAEYNYLKDLHKTYTGYPLVIGTTEQSSSPLFERVLKEVLPRIQAAKAEGKTYTQMFSKEINGRPNPDYIQPSVSAPSTYTLMKPTTAMFNGGVIPSTASKPVDTSGYKSVDDVGNAWKSGKLTKEQAYQIVHDKFGGFAPSVPNLANQ